MMANYFSIEEQTSLYSQKAEAQPTYFYELWTLKESFVKQSGEGLSKQLNTFSIKITDENITLDSDEKPPKPVFFKQYDIDPNYKIAACAETNDFAEMVPLSLQQIAAVF
ncbi:MAG: 4-phosphopantetheinyl transferase, partial [Daejeonella sp.]|nr:4-phosphopantetheinyl transferase [Daejeonella sp.]